MKEKAIKYLFVLLLVIFLIIQIYPGIWLFIASLKDSVELSTTPFSLPKAVTFENYKNVLGDGVIGGYMWNSLKITMISLVLILVLSATIGFALSKFRYKHSKKIYSFFMFGIMVPVQITLIPLFIFYSKIGILNTSMAMVLPQVGFALPLSVMMFVNFYNFVPDELIEAGIVDEFTRRFVDATAALKIGAPDNEENYLGPMARFDLRDELHQQVQATLAEGATLLLGGEKIAGAGNYYAATVLGNVTPTMTAFRQELFGPVAAITVATDADHALQLANDSDFGLSATVFTANTAMAERFARQLECGGVFINGYSASDARVAFGGVKKSGFGRELSHFGLHEFCNVQTVWKNRV